MKKEKLEKEFKELLIQVRRYNHGGDIEKIESAWEFAKLAHTGQKRKTGDPYASHSLETARVLADWKLDITSIIAGLLHDAVEDGGAKYCQSYVNPAAKWRLGICNFATHAKPEITVTKVRINPLKAAKRASKG